MRSEILRRQPTASGPAPEAIALRLPRWLTSEHPAPWLFPSLAMILAFGIYPLAYSLWLSFHKQNFFTRSMDFSGLLQWQAAFADPRMTVDVYVDRIEVDGSGRLAFAYGTGLTTRTERGAAVSSSSQWLAVFRKRDGAWEIAADAFNEQGAR